MAYDDARARVVLFGGNRTVAMFGDTWEWDGTTWTLRSPATSPPSRQQHAMAYDAARRRVVLFGGTTGGTVFRDTWEWDGMNWMARSPATSPLERTQYAMAYDSGRQRVVLFGGSRPDTWEWDGANWTQVSPAASPPARYAHAMAYDGARARTVVFSGVGIFLPFSDTWEYYPTVRGSATQVGAGCAGSNGVPTISASGPPIVGNRSFSIRLGSLRANAVAFLGVSAAAGNRTFGSCTVYPALPFLGVLQTTSNLAGIADLRFPIPSSTALSGVTVYLQGGALDPNGTLFGLAAMTKGLRIVVGD